MGGWVSDLGRAGVCCVCRRMPPGRSDRWGAGSAGRSVAGATAGCGAADLCMISPGGVRWLRASERGPGACCGAARAGRLCGFGILPNKFLQRKGPCMYRAIACKSSVLYIRLPCLQALGPLQEHTTIRESLVCYTTPSGGVWCCTIKVDIGNSKSQYIAKDKQEARKDGSESTKIQHGI